MPKGFSGGRPGGGGGGFSGGGRSGGFSGGFGGSRPPSRGPSYRPTGGGFLGGLVLGGLLGSSRNRGGSYNNGGQQPPPPPPKREPTRKRCNYCGSETDIKSEKCPNCGSSEFTVIDADAVSPDELKRRRETAEKQAKAQRKRSLITLSVIAGIITLFVIIIIVSSIASSQPDSGFTKKANVGDTVVTSFFDMKVVDFKYYESGVTGYTDPSNGYVYTAPAGKRLLVVTLYIKATDASVPFDTTKGDFAAVNGHKSDDQQSQNIQRFTLSKNEEKTITLCYIVKSSGKYAIAEWEYNDRGEFFASYCIRLY